MQNKLITGLGIIGLLACATTQASCGSTACSINTNWDEHDINRPGWRADLRYSYSRADSLRAGNDTINADTTFAGEVENLSTRNKITTATIDYTHDQHWGVMLNLPFISRDHAHNLGPYTGATSAGLENFHADALGDIKLVGRYRWDIDADTRSGMGVKFGLKLNTGKKNFTITETGDIPEEASLQPGNGSTDLILGLFWNQSTPGSNWSWFAQGMLQNSISSSAVFEPGNQVNIDAGTRYALNHNLSVLLQLNSQWNDADSGDSAALTDSGAESSGGRIVALTPGLSYTIASNTQLYGLVQVPFYQYVNGEQLTADSSMSAGISHRF